MKIDEEALKVAAKAIMHAGMKRFGHAHLSDETREPSERELHEAQEAIEAYTNHRASQGFVEMPREATCAMISVGREVRYSAPNQTVSDIWNAMFSAHEGSK